MDGRRSVGFLGIGLMGEAMVRRLLDRGWSVTVWNLEPARLDTVVPHGAIPAASPAAVAEASDIVLLCVLHASAVEDCVFGDAGVASATRAPRLLIDLSTTDPAATVRMATRLRDERGTAWVDAPVSGGPAKSRDGTLAIMAGGDPEAFTAAGPVLDDLGRTTHMGGVGAGQRTKLVNQAIVGAGYVLMAEAVALAEAAGIDAARVPECLAGGAADGALLRTIYPQMQARDFNPPRAYARQLLKDMIGVDAFATEHALALPVVHAAMAAYRDYVEAGNEMSDSAAIVTIHDRPRP